ncbi:apd1p [Saccharomyces arboricola H-6]|uniref:Apd1p n=1 Tax=Saccharomyces arboricola (strain H-6 / AS 2.3317 / CBS 10644) TaxID=1160507 RepID=J8PRK0_SACAR|nr:apd1p [Saccharomyces arboricola H-6]
MAFLNIFRRKEGDEASQLTAEGRQEISQSIEICEGNDAADQHDCSGDCKMDIEEGEKAFAKLKIEHETPLLNSSKTPRIHFVVPTSQTDWQHDACLENPKSVEFEISKWCDQNSGKFSNEDTGKTMNCGVSSLPKDIMDIEVMRGTKNNVLVLPYFIWLNDLKADNVAETLDDLVPALLNNTISREELLKTQPKISAARERAFVFICSHSTRDKRCGITAPYLKKVFDSKLQEHGLFRDNSDFRPDGVKIAFVNHVGGHKFAANVQIYLKDPNTLVWLGRVTPVMVPSIVEHLIVPTKPTLPFPEKIRCIKKYQSW